MRKNILSIAILLILAICFISCNKEEKDLLINTKWKLVGFVEVETGEMKETMCEITFKKYQKWEGQSCNGMEGKYKINYSNRSIKITSTV